MTGLRTVKTARGAPSAISTSSERNSSPGEVFGAAMDHQHQFAQNWEFLELINGWSNYFNGWEQARICLIANLVLVQGAIQQVGTNQVFAKIPKEYEPGSLVGINVYWFCSGIPFGHDDYVILSRLAGEYVLSVREDTITNPYLSISSVRYVL